MRNLLGKSKTLFLIKLALSLFLIYGIITQNNQLMRIGNFAVLIYLVVLIIYEFVAKRSKKNPS